MTYGNNILELTQSIHCFWLFHQNVFIALQNELVLVLRKKLNVLQLDRESLLQEIEDNSDIGSKVSPYINLLVPSPINQIRYNGYHTVRFASLMTIS